MITLKIELYFIYIPLSIVSQEIQNYIFNVNRCYAADSAGQYYLLYTINALIHHLAEILSLPTKELLFSEKPKK